MHLAVSEHQWLEFEQMWFRYFKNWPVCESQVERWFKSMKQDGNAVFFTDTITGGVVSSHALSDAEFSHVQQRFMSRSSAVYGVSKRSSDITPWEHGRCHGNNHEGGRCQERACGDDWCVGEYFCRKHLPIIK